MNIKNGMFENLHNFSESFAFITIIGHEDHFCALKYY